MNTMTRVAVLLILATTLLPAPVSADETTGQSPNATSPADESAARERYAKLIEQVEGPGRSCAIAQTTKAGLTVLQAFAKAAKFVDLDPAKPMRVTLPDDFYNPLGPTITFDQQALAIHRKNPTGPYISMTRTAEGVKLEPRIALETQNGKLLCFRYYNATLPYRVPASAAAPGE